MSMTADQIIAKAYLHAQRKATPPSAGSTKYNILLQIIDSMQKMWAAEPETEWDSLYSTVTLATVASSTDTYPMDASIAYISKREGDPILVTNGTSTREFQLVRPNQLRELRESDVVAQKGRYLQFSHGLGDYAGYSIKVPSILSVSDIDAGSDIVQVDDPMWLVYASAAEFDRNDVVKMTQYDNLLAMAELHMNRMKDNNSGQLETVTADWQPTGETWL